MRRPQPAIPTRSSIASTRPRAAFDGRQAEADIRGDVEMRKQHAVLRDVADAPPERRHPAARAARRAAGDGFSGEFHRPRVGAVESGDEAQQRGLAAARRAEQRHDVAGCHREVDVPQHARLAVGFGEA